ncbi:hypothetical protein BDA96_06G047300, partial [Sorghum bicolor]
QSRPSLVDGPDPVDLVTGLPLILCQSCKDVRLIALTSTRVSSAGKRFFKCPRNKEKDPNSCRSYYFQADYETLLRGIGKLLLPRQSPATQTQSTEAHTDPCCLDTGLQQQINELSNQLVQLGARLSRVCSYEGISRLFIVILLAFVFLLASIIAILAVLIYLVVSN